MHRLDCPGEEDPHRHVRAVTAATSSAIAGARARLAGRSGRHVERPGRGACRPSPRAFPSRMSKPGLRTHDPSLPWPEEEYRTAIDAHAQLLFAPTEARRGQPAGRARRRAKFTSPEIPASTLCCSRSETFAATKSMTTAANSRHLPPPRKLGRRASARLLRRCASSRFAMASGSRSSCTPTRTSRRMMRAARRRARHLAAGAVRPW